MLKHLNRLNFLNFKVGKTRALSGDEITGKSPVCALYYLKKHSDFLKQICKCRKFPLI